MSEIDRAHADWFEGEDPERAVWRGRGVLSAIARGEGDPVEDLAEIEEVIEPVWDGPGGDTDLAVRAMRNMQPAFVLAEKNGRLDRLSARLAPQRLLGRSEFRDKNYREALKRCLAIELTIEIAAEGHDRLVEIAGRSEQTELGNWSQAHIGLRLPTIRRDRALGDNDPTFPGQLAQPSIEIMRAFVPAALESPAARGPNSFGAVSQAFFYWVERLPEDRQMIEDLYALDLLTRPTDARSQATASLRDRTYLDWRGQREAAEAKRRQIVPSLERFPLPRHIEIVRQFGFA